MERAYNVVDVFTSRPFLGNPVGVVLNADDLSTEAMQSIAGWTNLSETTFVLTPTTNEADYRLRIFTPRSELPFAGHPTLGTAHALLQSGDLVPREGGRLVQQCAIGLVELVVDQRDGERHLSFSLPTAKIQSVQEADIKELECILGRELETVPAIVNVGAIWIVAQLKDSASVLELQPHFHALAELERRLGVTGLTVFGYREPYAKDDLGIEVRTFAPSCGVVEDPVCGSGNGSVAAYRWERGLLPKDGAEYVATQGRCVGRAGRVRIRVSASGEVRVGGACVTCVQGTIAV
jgi:PhzF family phenazine biosynthesis protein